MPLPASHRHDVVIIGAGFAGIGMAIRLRQAGFTDFVVLEQADDVGGTWRDNTYPGCACDIPGRLYSFSFAPDWDWSRRYPAQAEIHAYLRHCTDRFGVRPHLRLGTRLLDARHDPAAQRWRLAVDDGSVLLARVLIPAMGGLHHPALPPIPGLPDFAGPAFHSARWDHAVPLAGRRIAVIGTGASAVQLVPPLADQAGELRLFQRTPAWILGKRDPAAGGLTHAALRRVPLLRRIARAWTYWSHEARAAGFVLAPALMRAVERRARSHAKRQVADPALRHLLTPAYQIGCKRILLSNDFLPALTRAHVHLVTDPIARIVPDGVLTADGTHHPADVLVFATGFQAAPPLGPVRITNAEGRTLDALWQGGAPAFLGLAVPGFPNLFLLGGPNTGLGHNSVVFMLEAQIDHTIRALGRLRRQGWPVLAVREDVAGRCQAWLERRMRRTVWLTGCRSWYLGPDGRNTTLWPGFSIGYWLRVRLARASVYRDAEQRR
jgi:cation diffusion facilitator CzcD-associated flavoprotein CzcO